MWPKIRGAAVDIITAAILCFSVKNTYKNRAFDHPGGSFLLLGINCSFFKIWDLGEAVFQL